MKNKKLTVLALCFVAVAALFTTACNFGKDDFYGTWNSGDFEYDSTHTQNVTFYFSGTSDSLINSGKAFFWEHYTRSDGTETFWWGRYGTSDDSGVTSGNLTLRYFYGYNMKATGAKTLDELIALATGTDPETEFDNLANVTDFYDKADDECSDVERFVFALSGQDFWAGYQQFDATADCEWSELNKAVTTGTTTAENYATAYSGTTNGSSYYTKSNPKGGTSWGAQGTTRSFTLQSDNGSDYSQSDLEGNIIGTVVSSNDNVDISNCK